MARNQREEENKTVIIMMRNLNSYYSADRMCVSTLPFSPRHATRNKRLSLKFKSPKRMTKYIAEREWAGIASGMSNRKDKSL